MSQVSEPVLTLDHAPLGAPLAVASLRCPQHAPHWAQWLEEIGFLPGEQVMVTARGMPGGDPMVIRVGSSTFALRRAEAACVLLSNGRPA